MTDTAAKTKFSDLDKEGKLAFIQKQIDNLQAKFNDIQNDVVRVVGKKAVILPEVGDAIQFNHGRNTATTSAVIRAGVVVAVKPAVAGENGKTTPAQVKVEIGAGFDAEFVVIYPSQILPALVGESAE